MLSEIGAKPVRRQVEFAGISKDSLACEDGMRLGLKMKIDDQDQEPERKLGESFAP